MTKKISIIVPCYNVESYIESCLNSLINQTCKDELKIIVINDGSTDRTEEVILRKQAEYPDLIHYYKKENGGIANTRNYGLSLVDTEYFGFLDSDDWVVPTMFELMLKKAESESAEVTVCGFEWYFENNQKKNYCTLEGPYLPGKEMMIHLFATLWNKIYLTSFVQSTKLQFPDGYRYEDASFLYRLIPHIKKVAFINEPFIFYVQRAGSITHTHNEKVKDMIRVFEDILQYYKDNQFYENYQEELEYVFIRFFLGNSFLRTVQIKDKHDRELTLNLSWKILKENFPDWKKNKYLKNKGLKNLYYRLINQSNYWLFAKIFALLKG